MNHFAGNNEVRLLELFQDHSGFGVFQALAYFLQNQLPHLLNIFAGHFDIAAYLQRNITIRLDHHGLVKLGRVTILHLEHVTRLHLVTVFVDGSEPRPLHLSLRDNTGGQQDQGEYDEAIGFHKCLLKPLV